jgi:hypothetical protein
MQSGQPIGSIGSSMDMAQPPQPLTSADTQVPSFSQPLRLASSPAAISYDEAKRMMEARLAADRLAEAEKLAERKEDIERMEERRKQALSIAAAARLAAEGTAALGKMKKPKPGFKPAVKPGFLPKYNPKTGEMEQPTVKRSALTGKVEDPRPRFNPLTSTTGIGPVRAPPKSEAELKEMAELKRQSALKTAEEFAKRQYDDFEVLIRQLAEGGRLNPVQMAFWATMVKPYIDRTEEILRILNQQPLSVRDQRWINTVADLNKKMATVRLYSKLGTPEGSGAAATEIFRLMNRERMQKEDQALIESVKRARSRTEAITSSLLPGSYVAPAPAAAVAPVVTPMSSDDFMNMLIPKPTSGATPTAAPTAAGILEQLKRKSRLTGLARRRQTQTYINADVPIAADLTLASQQEMPAPVAGTRRSNPAADSNLFVKRSRSDMFGL